MSGHLAHRRANCQALLEELFGYLDGELSAARCQRIERHLEACPCCGSLAVRLKRAVAVCRSAGQSKLPADVCRQARVRITQLLGPSPATGRRGARRRRSGPGEPRG